MRIKSGITDWIDKAVKKPGAFTNYCKKHGYKGVTEDCINKAKKSKNHKTRSRANLAKTFKKINKK
ncbi:hypothetical protein [Thermococcus sp.]|uniref:hypothetical protein n=1 Tax=Thermococcus sp. TaxID=35749 RepID=UPI0026085B05|nr:hypothetical protein [Thermococcus sp.]